MEAGKAGRLEILVQDDASDTFRANELIGMPIGQPAAAQRNPANIGFAGTCNAGAARATKDILLFLNQDTAAHPGWFEPLMEMFDDLRIGIVGPKLIFPLNTIQSCGGKYDGGKGPYHRYLGWAADDWRVNRRERVSWTTGAALAVRRELFTHVGGFDTGYERGYFEDVDLCEAVKSLGYEIWYCPAAVFEHAAGSGGGVPAHIFKSNSMRFHRRWDARIAPDTPIVHVNY